MSEIPSQPEKTKVEKLKEKAQRLKQEADHLRQEIQHQAVAYIVAAFSLVAGLAWNDAIKALIEYFFPKTENSLKAQFIYAGILTLILVIVSVYLIRFLGKREEKLPPK